MITFLKVMIYIISLYIFFESLCAVSNFPNGVRAMFCHRVKYVLALSISIAFIYTASCLALTSAGWHITAGSALTIAFFIWPRTVWRIKQRKHPNHKRQF